MNLLRAIDLRRNKATHRLRRVPVVVLMPHSRCNCRCIMCDIWKANRNGTSLSQEHVSALLDAFRDLGVEWVLLSGGEPLMHPNLWGLCASLRTLPVRITLLSTGLLLARHAADVTRYCHDVIVSLDGSEHVHDRIRGVPNAFRLLAEGVAALRMLDARYPVTGRCVLQRWNLEDLPNIIAASRRIGLDHISFLAADVSSPAFNRPGGWTPERRAEVSLSPEEAERLGEIVEETLVRHAEEFSSGFVMESPEKMRSLVSHFRAAAGGGAFPGADCNAPWVSTVIEADGTVRPCYFHRAIGNIHERTISDILNSEDAIAFRRQLDVHRDATCRRCVCRLNLTQ